MGDYPSVIQLRQLTLPHSGEEFLIGYREEKDEGSEAGVLQCAEADDYV